MSKKPAKPAKAAPAADPDQPQKKRSKLKLALLALVPLALGGGGYGGWTFFMASPAEATVHDEHAAEGAAHGGVDPLRVAALAREAAAETSFTYSFALSVLLKERCGPQRVASLAAASEEEAAADGLIVNLSWVAAHRRTGTVTEVSCDRMRAEIDNADAKAEARAAEKAAEAAKAEKGGGGGH